MLSEPYYEEFWCKTGLKNHCRSKFRGGMRPTPSPLDLPLYYMKTFWDRTCHNYFLWLVVKIPTCILNSYDMTINHKGYLEMKVHFCPLKGKLPRTTLWIGWVESNFTNPTVKVWAIWIIHLCDLIMQSFVCRPLWMELCQIMWCHKIKNLFDFLHRFSQLFIFLRYE